MQSFILPANNPATPESIKRKRRMAEAMLSQGIDTSPIASPWQGAARMAQALVGGLGSRKADKQEAEGSMAAREAMIKALNGGDNAAVAEAVTNPFTENNSIPFLKERYAQLNPDMNSNGAEYGLQPIITQGADGKYHLFQASKSGGPPKEMALPFGWTPKMQFLNQETQFAPVATQGILQPGQGPAPIPINNAQAATETKIGTGTGEAANSYNSIKSKMPGLENVVGQLDELAKKATYTLAGQALNAGRTQLGMSPTEGAVARTTYQSMVANQILPLLRDTFGAQFTQVEGERLLATLGDPDKTPVEKQAVLKAFIEQKRRDVEALGVQGRVNPAQEEVYDAQGNRIQ